MHDVLGSADVLVAVIERDAGEYSVPSKILSYLCAGRPIVLAAPKENLASKIISQTKAGLVVEPEDLDGFCKAAEYYINNKDKANIAGENGRKYAESNFNMGQISKEFEDLFTQCLSVRVAK